MRQETMLCKASIWLVMLILGNIIWIPAGVHGSDQPRLPLGQGSLHGKVFSQTAYIRIYPMKGENREACRINQRREAGHIPINVSGSKEVSGGVVQKEQYLGDPYYRKVAFFPEYRGLFVDNVGLEDWELFEQWWERLKTDTKTSLCGVVDPGKIYYWADDTRNVGYYTFITLNEPVISDADLQRLRGVIITEWPAQLKLTVTGPNVKVEPLEACLSDDGKCEKSVLWQRQSLCPEGTKPGGKGSICARGEPGEATPNHVERPTSPDEEPEENPGCCWPQSGACSNTHPDMCSDMNGEPFPLGQACSGDFEADCAARTGACMVGEECFPLETFRSCKNLHNGTYRGGNTRCPPKSDKRACCVDGYCDLKTKEECKGEFLDHATACRPDICPETKVGCCLPGGSCNNFPPMQCGLLYGEALPQEEICRGVNDARCADLLGACMVGEKCIPMQTESSCAAIASEFHKEFLGSGRKCPSDEEGACCVDGKCDITTKSACDGDFLEGVTACKPNTCLQGACCVDGQCDITTKGACAGDFLEGATACKPDICLKGSCCVDGKCDIKIKDACEGRFLEGVTVCEPDICLKGACCIDGKCAGIEKEGTCLAKKDATFLEGVTACEPDTCPQPEPPTGGCCNEYGECKEEVGPKDCMGEHETYFSGGCPDRCPDVLGACTMDCPTSDGKDCLVMSGRKCKSLMGDRFEPGGECPVTDCLNCYNCDEVFGEWIYTQGEKNLTLTLDLNCKSKLSVTQHRDDDEGDQPTLPTLISEEAGIWGCSGRIVAIIWLEVRDTWVTEGEGGNMRLCTRDGDQSICARRVMPKLNSRLKGIGQGRQQ